MARKTHSALGSWEYPKKSGIRIHEVLNLHGGEAFGASYLVFVPAKLTGKDRERKQFKTRTDAEKWADKTFDGYRKEGEGFFSMSDAERRDMAACLPLLREKGISVGEAIRFAAKMLQPESRTKSLHAVITELIESKKQRCDRGDLRERSYRDFRQRGESFAAAFEGRLAAEITMQEIKTWLLDQKLGPRTNRNHLAAIAEMFRYALQKQYVSFSPLDRLTDVDRKELCGRVPPESHPRTPCQLPSHSTTGIVSKSRPCRESSTESIRPSGCSVKADSERCFLPVRMFPTAWSQSNG